MPSLAGSFSRAAGIILNVGVASPGISLPSSDTPFRLLLGRDVICDGLLTLSFDGHFSFAL